MTAPVLQVTGLAHRFGAREVLRSVDLSVESGEVFGLLGPNGSGKSTLLNLLTGSIPLSAGEVRLDGVLLRPESRELRRAIGVVFQSPSLDGKLTVRENLRLVATMYGLTGAARRDAEERGLALARLGDRADSRVQELSGGMKRRLDIARALLPAPRVLFMDEPTAGLDEVSFRALWEHLEAANRRDGVTIVVSTHRPDEAARCSRVAVVDQGTIVRVATPAALCAGLARDRVVVGASDATGLAARLTAALGVDAAAVGDEVHVGCDDGHVFVPRLFEVAQPGEVRTVAVRRPDLADAFLALTGRSLESDTTGEAA
ncbi:MAG: ABC transporter ATP-binding protein [Myxococcales bacterium]|nr:ABC transporter ATP-binding protein [Myxococcales bacterium]MCB9533058.1 ABC transporter ATP-binding protein [Myxococcales bacterium]